MGSLTFSEMATIAIIVLIVFGPRRLPELARRAGTVMAKVRDATRELRDELREEYAETVAPLEEVRRDLEAARRDVADAAKAVSGDLQAAAKADAEAPGSPLDEVRKQLRDARDELTAESEGPAQPDTPDEVDEP